MSRAEVPSNSVRHGVTLNLLGNLEVVLSRGSGEWRDLFLIVAGVLDHLFEGGRGFVLGFSEGRDGGGYEGDFPPLQWSGGRIC